jgi:two-component system NtrC family sensor kinase
MFDLHNFTFAQMIRVAAHLRRLGSGATSMEDAAHRIVHYFHEQLVCNEARDRACVLVRLFKTHPYCDLDDELRLFATKMLNGATPSPSMKCLVLLATAGEKPEWNSRFTSGGHKAIPLVSESAVQKSPMISQLLSQLGLSFSTLQHADASLLVDSKQSAFNVFHVPEAEGSP